jgi:hypothetical protein
MSSFEASPTNSINSFHMNIFSPIDYYKLNSIWHVVEDHGNLTTAIMRWNPNKNSFSAHLPTRIVTHVTAKQPICVG